MNTYEEQYFLNYPADGGEPYFVFDGKKTTKSSMIESLSKSGYSKQFSELLIETGYAFAAIYDLAILHLHVTSRLDKERKNNWHLGRADQNPYEIGANGMTGYWEMVECLYENGLTWDEARKEVAKGRYEEIMYEKGRDIDEGPSDLSGWDSLDNHEVSEGFYQQIQRTDDKFPYTREQTIDVIKLLISYGYSTIMAQIFAAEGAAIHLIARGNAVYASIKDSLRGQKTDMWHGLDEPFVAPYIVMPKGGRCTYYDVFSYFMEDGDSLKTAMRKMEILRPKMLE